MFVQIHTLRDYSTALPNRGQDGLAKRTIYGGIERQRISSQSFKATMRDNLTLVRIGKEGAIVSDTMKDLAERARPRHERAFRSDWGSEARSGTDIARLE